VHNPQQELNILLLLAVAAVVLIWAAAAEPGDTKQALEYL
jgi:hypothetical protein